jgi:hypothetical protein
MNNCLKCSELIATLSSSKKYRYASNITREDSAGFLTKGIEIDKKKKSLKIG